MVTTHKVFRHSSVPAAERTLIRDNRWLGRSLSDAVRGTAHEHVVYSSYGAIRRGIQSFSQTPLASSLEPRHRARGYSR
eukprot:1094751-Prymnesium_polylepis.1